jgi:hypothetical protein
MRIARVTGGVGNQNKPSGRSLLYLPHRFVGLHTFFDQMYIFWPHEESLQITSDFPTACALQSLEFYEICIWICNPKILREHSTALATIAILWHSPILEERVARLLDWTFVGEPTRSACAILISYQVGQYMARPREEISHATSWWPKFFVESSKAQRKAPRRHLNAPLV